MSLLCLDFYGCMKFYLFPERFKVLNVLSQCDCILKIDFMITEKNKLKTHYDLDSEQLTFITQLCSGYYETYRKYSPFTISSKPLESIMVDYIKIRDD